MENLGHLMVDIETMGNKSNAVICSIAAVEFDLKTGATGKTFHRKIRIDSALKAGLKIDASTLEWWMLQSQEAREGLFKNGFDGVSDLSYVLRDFFDFVESLNGLKIEVWGNSARFDLGILENAFNACNMATPWKHWNERCVRTLASFAPEVKKDMPFEGIKHDALADCYHQIKYSTIIYNTLKSEKQ